MLSPFQWGKGGRAMTPDQVERERLLVAAAQGRAGDTSPVGHWSQGAARVVDTLGGVLRDKRANKAEDAGMAGADAYVAGNPVLSALIGGNGGGMPAPIVASSSSASASAAAPAPVDPSAVAPAVIPGGPMAGAAMPAVPAPVVPIPTGYSMPPEVKNGIFAGESGGDYDALFGFSNRPGGKFENVRLTDMTVDEALAFAAPSGEYGQTVKGQIGRVATPMGGYQVVGTTLRAAKKGMGLTGNEKMTPEMQDQIGGWILAEQGTGAWEGYKGPRDGFTPASGGPAQFSASSASGYGGGGGAGVTAALAAAMSDPWVAKKYGPVLEALMGQEMKRGDMQYQAQLAQSDPMYALELDRARMENDAMRNPAPPDAPKPIEVGGVLLDPVTFEPIFDSRTPEGADSRYQPVDGQIWDMQPEGGGPPVLVGGGSEEIIYGPDGTPIVTRGPAGSGKAFTEGQSKDVVYATRAKGALEALDPIAGVLTGRWDVAAGWLPIGLGGGMQSDEYQVAKTAGDEFLQAILRKDTGAAITSDEQVLYGETYIPRPGDSAARLEYKKEARHRAIAAIEAGMSPSQIVAQEKALERGERPAAPDTSPMIGTGSPATGSDFSQMGLAEIGQVDIGSLTPEQMDALEVRMKELGL